MLDGFDQSGLPVKSLLSFGVNEIAEKKRNSLGECLLYFIMKSVGRGNLGSVAYILRKKDVNWSGGQSRNREIVL